MAGGSPIAGVAKGILTMNEGVFLVAGWFARPVGRVRRIVHTK